MVETRIQSGTFLGRASEAVFELDSLKYLCWNDGYVGYNEIMENGNYYSIVGLYWGYIPQTLAFPASR